MGATYVTAVIRNPADCSRSWEGRFLIDTGACNCVVPRSRLDVIGLEPKGQHVYEMADGSEVAMDVTTGEIEFMGELVGGTIVYGDDDTEPLLGMTALASAGFKVDPLSQTLRKLPAVSLKSRFPSSRSSSSLADLSDAQGVAPVDDLEDVTALWPSDDGPDELLTYLLAERAARRRVSRDVRSMQIDERRPFPYQRPTC